MPELNFSGENDDFECLIFQRVTSHTQDYIYYYNMAAILQNGR